MGRYRIIASLDVFSATANTDMVTDITITQDALIRIMVATVDDGDFRISVDGGTTFNSLVGATGITTWNIVEMYVNSGDVINFQTVANETVDLRVLLDEG